MNQTTGTAIDIKNKVNTMTYCVTGVKAHHAHEYRQPKYFGSNGTYRMGYPTRTHELNVVVKVPGHPHMFVDVLEDALAVNGRKNVTEKFVEELKSVVVGKVVYVNTTGKSKLINTDILKI